MGKIADAVAQMMADGARSIDVVAAVARMEAQMVARAAPAPGAAMQVKGFEAEFSTDFWPMYPHKTGKPVALKAFVKARQKGTGLASIMGGLAAYIDHKRVDQPWLNPSTFLNQERWADVPAPVAPSKPPSAASMFSAFAERLNDDEKQGGGNFPPDEPAILGLPNYAG